MADKYTTLALANAAYTNTGNWIGAAAPTAADNIFAQFSTAIAWDGSDQSATELGDITVLPTCTGNAGTADAYLQLDQATSASTVFAGRGTWYLDLGTSGSALVRVDQTGTAQNGRSALYFKNETNAITTFIVKSGSVRLVNANITTLVVKGNATVIIDSSSTVGTIEQEAGTVIDNGCTLTTWNITGGTGTKDGSDAYACNVYGGTLYNDGTGTATAVVYGGVFDSIRDSRAKSVTLTVRGGTSKIGANVTLTETLDTGVTILA